MDRTHDVAGVAYGTSRATPQRRVIASAVAGMPGAFTVDDLATAVRRVSPRAGATATVYRAVAAMVESGFLVHVGSRQGAALYARCEAASQHHHHIVCDGCGRVAHADCPLPAWREATPGGFVITRHEVTMYGLCPTCSAGRRGA